MNLSNMGWRQYARTFLESMMLMSWLASKMQVPSVSHPQLQTHKYSPSQLTSSCTCIEQPLRRVL